MNIAIGCDHTALDYKRTLVDYLTQRGHELFDCGTPTEASCDYPVIGEAVARKVQQGECQMGILICGTGLGMSYAANKLRGIRAAACSETISAALARQHNDAQIVCMGARIVGIEVAKAIAQTFIDTPFSQDARHQKRIDMIGRIEDGER